MFKKVRTISVFLWNNKHKITGVKKTEMWVFKLRHWAVFHLILFIKPQKLQSVDNRLCVP